MPITSTSAAEFESPYGLALLAEQAWAATLTVERGDAPGTVGVHALKKTRTLIQWCLDVEQALLAKRLLAPVEFDAAHIAAYQSVAHALRSSTAGRSHGVKVRPTFSIELLGALGETLDHLLDCIHHPRTEDRTTCESVNLHDLKATLAILHDASVSQLTGWSPVAQRRRGSSRR